MKRFVGVGCALLVCLVPGCPGPIFGDNPAEVLEGVWQVEFDEPGDLEGYDIEVTFDNNGQVTLITAESPEGGTARLDVDDSTTTEVDGDDVTISIPRAAGGATVLEGTLSADENTIDGNLSQQLDLPSGDIEVTLPGSGVTLTRNE